MHHKVVSRTEDFLTRRENPKPLKGRVLHFFFSSWDPLDITYAGKISETGRSDLTVVQKFQFGQFVSLKIEHSVFWGGAGGLGGVHKSTISPIPSPDFRKLSGTAVTRRNEYLEYIM